MVAAAALAWRRAILLVQGFLGEAGADSLWSLWAHSWHARVLTLLKAENIAGVLRGVGERGEMLVLNPMCGSVL